MTKTAVLVSGGGTNLQALIDAKLFGLLPNCELAAVISSSPNAYALIRAQNANIPTYVMDKNSFPNRSSLTEAIVKKLKELEIELIVMAGFILVLTRQIFDEFPYKIINIHPSLIPSFCGDGHYGIHVHEKALEYGVKLTGATAHFVTYETDNGPIIIQKAVEVHEDDTPEILQARVMREAEWEILPQAVGLFCDGRLTVEGRIVRISDNGGEKC